MLRKNSTQALPARTSQTLSVVRIVPITEPNASAITHEQAETASVQ
jgi:hypothetical protein